MQNLRCVAISYFGAKAHKKIAQTTLHYFNTDSRTMKIEAANQNFFGGNRCFKYLMEVKRLNIEQVG